MTEESNYSPEVLQEDVIQWHSAFYSAMRLEFMEDSERLEFYPEKILNTAPLRIDLLILLLNGEEKLKNPIGKIFGRYNILEYKSPDDSMGIDDFYKVIAYAALYKGKSKTNNGYCAKEITITMVRESYPREMIKQLKTEGFQVISKEKGIYEVWDSIFRTQIVVTRCLAEKEHVWLKSLTRNLSIDRLKNLAKEYKKLPDENWKSCVDSIVDVVSQANFNLIKKWKEDALMNAAVAELFRPEVENLKMLLEQERQAKEQERQAKEALLEEVERLKQELKKK